MSLHEVVIVSHCDRICVCVCCGGVLIIIIKMLMVICRVSETGKI